MGGYVAPLHPSIAGVQPLLPTRPARRRPMCNLILFRVLQKTEAIQSKNVRLLLSIEWGFHSPT